jgi:hypothetical protein
MCRGNCYMIEALFSCCHFGKFLGGYFPRDGRLQPNSLPDHKRDGLGLSLAHGLSGCGAAFCKIAPLRVVRAVAEFSPFTRIYPDVPKLSPMSALTNQLCRVQSVC